MVTYSAKQYCHCPLVTTHFPSCEGRRLSWPEWFVTYQDGILRTVTRLSTNRVRLVRSILRALFVEFKRATFPQFDNTYSSYKLG